MFAHVGRAISRATTRKMRPGARRDGGSEARRQYVNRYGAVASWLVVGDSGASSGPTWRQSPGKRAQILKRNRRRSGIYFAR